MALCSSRLWTLGLILDSNTGAVERLSFDLTITANGMITGVVINSLGERMSQVRGQCETIDSLPGLPPLAFMSLIFRVKRGRRVRGIHMSGIVFDPDPAHPGTLAARFQGRLRTSGLDSNVPPAHADNGELQTIALAADPGDTGTGTGQQT